MANLRYGNKGKGPQKKYTGGAKPDPDNSLGAKDKKFGTDMNAEAVPFFRDRDKELTANRANQPNMPVRRTSTGDATQKSPKK